MIYAINGNWIVDAYRVFWYNNDVCAHTEKHERNTASMKDVKYQSTIKKTRNKTIFVAVAVIAFFVTIILTFYVFMYSSVKDNIRMQGEKFALEAAEKFDRYFTMSSNLVRLEKEMLDQMLVDSRDRKRAAFRKS